MKYLSITQLWLAYLYPHRYFLFVVTLYFLSRLLYLGSDFHVLEPDEALYARLAQEFIVGRWPKYNEGLYLEVVPVFHFLAGWLQSVFGFWGPLVGVRLLAVIGGFFGGLGFYCYGTHIRKTTYGLTLASIYWLMPLGFFYSRSGTLEMFYLGWVILWWSLLTISSPQKKRFGIGAGILFLLAVLAKPSALIFLTGIGILALIDPGRKHPVLTYFCKTFFLLSLLIFGGYLWYFKFDFVNQALELPAKHLLPLTNLTVHLATQWEYLKRVSWYLSWPMLIPLVLGLQWGIGQVAKHYSFRKISHSVPCPPDLALALHLMSLLLPALLFGWLFDFSPRYFTLYLPVATLLIGQGLYMLKKPILIWIVLLLTLPSTYLAWQSTLHMSITKVSQTVQELEKNHKTLPIYSSVDPKKISYYLGREVPLLTTQALKGSIVIVDDRKTELFAAFTQPEFISMKAMLNNLFDKHLVLTESDPLPHYPVDFRGNTFRVYLLPEKNF